MVIDVEGKSECRTEKATEYVIGMEGVVGECVILG